MADATPVLTPTESRQASPRRMNFHVLVWSMALVVIVAAILYFVIYAKPESPIGMPKEQPATSAPAPAAAGQSLTQSLRVTRS